MHHMTFTASLPCQPDLRIALLSAHTFPIFKRQPTGVHALQVYSMPDLPSYA